MKYAVGIMLSFSGMLLAMNEVKNKQAGSQIAGARVPALTMIPQRVTPDYSPADAAQPEIEIDTARSASSRTSPDDAASTPVSDRSQEGRSSKDNRKARALTDRDRVELYEKLRLSGG